MPERSHVSPWSVDPISWVTTASIPVATTALVALYGVVDLLWLSSGGGAVQWLGLVLMIGAGLLVHCRTRPPRGVLGAPEVVAVLVLLTAATLISAAGYIGSPFSLTLWWVPLGMSLVIVAMAPYMRPTIIALVALTLIAIVGAITFLMIVPDDASWPPLTTTVIVITPIVAGGTLSAVLSNSIVRRLLQWSERPLPVVGVVDVEGIDDRAIVRAVDDDVSEQLAAAASFLRDIAQRGSIDAEHAQRARALALDLRARLIAEASATWLERVVRDRPVQVDDPERLADRMSVSQRTALRAMIDALLAHPESGFVSARIALRASDSGDVAVAMRINTTLPEGRRISFLAPYYVSLSSAVHDIRWRDGANLDVEFEVPAVPTAGRAPLVQRTPRVTESAQGSDQRPE